MKFSYLILLLPLLCCSPQTSPEQLERWKAEVIETERDFCDMAKKEGLDKAFSAYAATESAIKRGGKLVLGSEAIAEWYKNDMRPGDTLTWAPDFVDVSASGDMAYTYGGFTFKSLDAEGNAKESTGYFHTVWKRQDDGQWKFVWD